MNAKNANWDLIADVIKDKKGEPDLHGEPAVTGAEEIRVLAKLCSGLGAKRHSFSGASREPGLRGERQVSGA